VDYQEAVPSGKISMHRRDGSTNSHWVPTHPNPSDAELQRAADILNQAKRPVLLVGQGARGAGAEVIQIAEKLGAPIVKALLGKEVVPDDHPLCTGGLGLLGTTPSVLAMEECDTLLIIGSSFPYMEYLPKPGKVRGIQIDDRADRIGLRYPVDVGLVGDARQTTADLSALIHPHEDRGFLRSAQKEMKEWTDLLQKQCSADSIPIKPQRVAWELSEIVSDDAIISTDTGTITSWIARYFRIRGTQKFSCSGNLATMAPGLPYAIAAKLAFPRRQSIAFVGDGGFSMLMAEFLTAVKYQLPIVVVLIKNNTLGMIKWEQMVFLGNPEYGCDLQNPDFAQFASACGGLGWTVEKPEDIRPTLERAILSNRPSLVEVVVDPFEPPMPPKVSAKQTLHLAEALVKGEPHRGRIALTLFRDKVDERI
jgi:pyruvate dehydrogenase (quinone)/pyruvate oxidase